MAGLASEIEEVILVLNQVSHAVDIPHIGHVDVHLVADSFDIKKIAAILRDQAIDERQVRPETCQAARQIGTNKAQASGD